MNRVWLVVGVLAGLVTACGGKAIIDDPIGAGGAGGSDNTGGSLAITVTSSSSGGSIDTSSGTGPSGSSECLASCERLWVCGFDQGFCQKFEAGDEEGFIQSCTSNPLCDARAALIEGRECREIIGLLKSLSKDFDESCN